MSYINENFLKLEESYLFSQITKKVEKFTKENPNKKIINLGIGDVTKPIVPAVIEAMHKAVDEMGSKTNFKGYGPEQGYLFLRKAIIENEYKPKNIKLDENEIFISDGAKCDCGNIVDIFAKENKVAITNPVYPVYVDSNIMSGREIIYLPLTEKNNFEPELPKEKVDIIYLCSPNNPTGTALSKEKIQEWVEYAKKNKSIILYDSAYEAFITDPEIPHSIYEVDGAKEVAIEIKSYSKTAGFTGLRCAYLIIPKQLQGYTHDGKNISINQMWNRRTCTKFNGASYISQKAAEAIYTKEGKKQIENNIKSYLKNAKKIKETLQSKGYIAYGGINSPYIWLKVPKQMTSWEFFDYLLEKSNIVGTPGSGFGKYGEGFFRLTAFTQLINNKL